jgi:predicted dehydrogenase
MQRSWPEFRQAVELVRNGYIGQIKGIKVSVGGPPVAYNLPEEKLPEGLDWNRWLGPNEYKHYNHQLNPSLTDTFWGKWRDFKEFGGGGMTDWGAHMFDIVQWALDMDNSGPVSIIPPDGKEQKFLTYTYANGIRMTHENFGINNAVQFTGSEGTVVIQRGKLVTTPASLQTKIIGANEKKVYHSDNHYQDFLNAIKNRNNPICDVEIGHRTASVCTLGNIAYSLKRPLTWDPRKEKFKDDREANDLRSRKLKKEFSI